MKYVEIISNQFSKPFIINGINEEDSLVDQLVYITIELYKQVCKEIKRRGKWEQYTENRAYFIGHTIKDVLRRLKYEVGDIRKESPVTLNAVIDEERHINCEIEFNTHQYFIEKTIKKQSNYLDDMKINWGFCLMNATPDKRIWPLPNKGKDMNLWIGVKFTDPEKELPVELDIMFDTVIHEFVHLMDNIERYYSKKLALIITKPLLKKTLIRFFTFKKIEN